MLPLGDTLIDRWDKAAFLGFGEGTSVYDSCVVFGDVKVGTNCWIGPFTVLDGSGGLSIGNNCTVGAGAHIYSHNSVNTTLHQHPIERKPVHIADRVYLGPNAVIAYGVSIGTGAVVGANALVTCDIPAFAKAVGNPARILLSTTEPNTSPNT